MQRRVGATAVYYECSCGHSMPGTRESRLLLSSGAQRSTSTADKYGAVLLCAPFSRTVLRVPQPCKNCGLPYLTQVNMGENAVIIRVCRCGYRAGAAQ